MADAQLSVELSAQVNGFVSALARAASESSRTEGVVTAMSNNISRNIANVNRLNLSGFQRSLQAGQVSLTRLSQTVQNAPQQLSRLSVGSNQAANALQNLGRVAQDAPFGFIGIQNNLNPLLESFQRLRQETGSNGAAFKALAGSLLGAGGIGLALSLVTSAITLYVQYTQRANKATKELAETSDDYIKSLDAVQGALLKGTQNGAKEISNLRVLYELYQNANVPLAKRRDAYKEIQKEYPAYFGNLKFEANATAVTTQAYEKLTLSIIATAKARALSDKIGENSIKEAELANKILNTQNEINKSKKEDTGFAAALGGSRETQGLLADQVKLQDQLNGLRDQDLRLQKEITKQVQGQAEVKGNFDGVGEIDKETKATRTLSDVLKELNIELVQADNTLGSTFGDVRKDKVTAYQKAIDDLIKLGFKPANAEIEKLKAAQEDLFNGVLRDVPKPSGITSGTSAPALVGIQLPPLATVQTGLTDIEKALRTFNSNVNDIINNGIVSTFESLGTSIGSALANGTNIFASVAQGLLGTLGGLMTQLGKVAIETGVGIAAIKTALKTLNPAVAIGAGVALITLGSAISGKVANLGGGGSQYQGVKQIPGFATGVTNFGGGLAMVGERGRELVNLPTGSSVIPNGRTERLMKGGNSMINISSELAISGGQLYALIRAEERSRGRAGI